MDIFFIVDGLLSTPINRLTQTGLGVSDKQVDMTIMLPVRGNSNYSYDATNQ
jgi:hypothetical protein